MQSGVSIAPLGSGNGIPPIRLIIHKDNALFSYQLTPLPYLNQDIGFTCNPGNVGRIGT